MKKFLSFFLFVSRRDLSVYFGAECANSIHSIRAHETSFLFTFSFEFTEKHLSANLLLFEGKTENSLYAPPTSILSIFDRVIYCVIPPWNKSTWKRNAGKHIGMMNKLIKIQNCFVPMFQQLQIALFFSVKERHMHLHWFWKCIHAVEIYDLCLR